ncbi:MAG: lysostaphin resistance A-like protein [Flavobacteriaceae bacterium]
MNSDSIPNTSKPIDRKKFLFDIVIYISIMFLVREIYFPELGFLTNGIFWTLTTLVVATWRMRVRNVTWGELGLCKPKSILKTFGVSVLILVAVVIAMIVFEMVKDNLPMMAPEAVSEDSSSRFGNLKGNWMRLLFIMPVVLLESMLEELLDRGFLINWIERLFSSTTFATAIAVVLQAVIFGFRHSYDFSARSLSVGIIGLIMGIAYVKSGRNLWPLIIAHCLLNTMSMIDRVQ